MPRDRKASFDPQLLAKCQRRFPGFDDKILSMYARGMSTGEIVGHLHDLYGIDVSPDLVSAVTDAALRTSWKMPPREWSLAKAQCAVLFDDRFTKAMVG